MDSYSSSQPQSIQEMFATIAKGYDRANDLLSFGTYRYWNALFVKNVFNENAQQNILDLCAGTGDIAFRILKKSKVLQNVSLVDFCSQMLQEAKKKALVFDKKGHKISIVQGDAMNLDFQDSSFDLLTMAYGIRNVKDPRKVFLESHRVLRPGGVLGVLELTRPKNPFFLSIYLLYLHLVLPLVSKLFFSNKKAYLYLAKSISDFQSADSLKSLLLDLGFENVKVISLFGGICSIIKAKKRTFD